jgi:hypothetical protein
MQFRVGQKVRVLDSRLSVLEDGDVGFITEAGTESSYSSYRVQVKGKDNYANWIHEDDMELVEMTGEDMQEYLKANHMEEQMLRQLMMTMPMEDVSYWYAERILLGETGSEIN